MGVPLVIIHFSRIFHYKPTMIGYPHLWTHPPKKTSEIPKTEPPPFPARLGDAPRARARSARAVWNKASDRRQLWGQKKAPPK